jgi:hypothetical protein
MAHATETKVTKSQVEARVRDWIRRLNELYARLDKWMPNDPAAKVRKEHLVQVIEPLMSQFRVAPHRVPTYTVLIGRRRIAFVPSALWVIGANGRVNVSTNARQHILVDLGGQASKESDWQLVLPDDRTSLNPFNRQAFLSLLEEAK